MLAIIADMQKSRDKGTGLMAWNGGDFGTHAYRIAT